MSVSDPLLKKLKGFIVKLRTDPDPIHDDHCCLQAFCETIETIFRKGLKQSASLFQLKQRDYWHWIENIGDGENIRVNPIFTMAVAGVKTCGKVLTTRGRGRFFIRMALQKKVLRVPVEYLSKDVALQEVWYDPGCSILGDEILCEILKSLLYEVTEVNFQLRIKNASFLDETWALPVYRSYEFVPCKDLGLLLHIEDGRAVAFEVHPGSVAEEDNKIEPGDILDEIQGECLRNARKGRIPTIIKQSQNVPIYLSVIKCRRGDGSMYRPIVEIMRKIGMQVNTNHIESKKKPMEYGDVRMPPHALLPEDEPEEVPIHHSQEAAHYNIRYLGNTPIGSDGGVHKIEGAIGEILKWPKDKLLGKEVSLELGETDIFVKDRESQEIILKQSYTEISSCGRRVDCVEYFAFLAGETTCSLAKDFIAYVFKANTDEESKTILCAIAQGFGRTHWFI